MRSERGFSLLEALVALVILAGAGMALFSWISGSLASLHRIESANQRSDAEANVIEYMQAVNPTLTPQGHADFGDYAIEWTSEPSSTVMDGVGYPQGLSRFQLALYKTKVSAARADDRHWFQLDMSLVGYKSVRLGSPPV